MGNATLFYSDMKTTHSVQLTSSTESWTDSSADPAVYGCTLPSIVSFGSGTWSTREHISGGQTWIWVCSDRVRFLHPKLGATVNTHTAYMHIHTQTYAYIRTNSQD